MTPNTHRGRMNTMTSKRKGKVFETSHQPKPDQGWKDQWKVTMVVEAASPEMFDWGMKQAQLFGRQMYIGISLHHQDDPTARVAVRTTKLRKKKADQ